ncbi:hypothetical protein [Rhizobacter sp. Root1221]|uniref:GH12 family glycosyl hydrolase domain-containing protein n=1 Tax=Rhizobacter sp. Root1221 TaxID=1736433 RepID=UPI0007004780|nr:hypothetical protein [Rhizobacter sp. Root1221]KQV95729.1 hypothetical protein ASC87_04025 [Rhizobacter sp. Root1221]
MNHLPFAAALLLALSACQSAPVVPSPSLPADARAHCKNGDAVVIGPYKYENNMWGLDKVRGFTPEQCLLTREVDGRTEVGWKWHWPGLDYTVFAYPQIMYGWKPWSGGKPSDVRFPLRVDRITELTIDYAVETEATGSYNLAPEVWLMRDGQWSEKADPSRISGEIMFWMDYREGARPAGQVVGHPVVGGVTYELWKLDNIGDKGDGTGWTIYSFKSPTRQRSGRIPVHELLAYMVANKHIRTDEHVASVEFGNEVMGGTGTTWVKRFKVEVGPLRP